MYIAELANCLMDGREYDQTAFFKQLEEFENNWAINGGNMMVREPSDPYELSVSLYNKWFNN